MRLSSFLKYSKSIQKRKRRARVGAPDTGFKDRYSTNTAAAILAGSSMPKRLTTPTTMITALAIKNPDKTGDDRVVMASSRSSPKYMK